VLSIDPTSIAWPAPWRPITDESEALSFGRWINPQVAPTILGELRREICDRHPLYGVGCIPLAYDSRIKKDFLFASEHPEMPLVLVHFTWVVEAEPHWPFVIPYRTVRAFVRSERRRSMKPWQLWKLWP